MEEKEPDSGKVNSSLSWGWITPLIGMYAWVESAENSGVRGPSASTHCSSSRKTHTIYAVFVCSYVITAKTGNNESWCGQQLKYGVISPAQQAARVSIAVTTLVVMLCVTSMINNALEVFSCPFCISKFVKILCIHSYMHIESDFLGYQLKCGLP